MKLTRFIPPIEERETEDLIGIAHSDTYYWQQEAIDHAKKELERRNVSKEFQLELVKKWEDEFKAYERQWEQLLKENEGEKYSIRQQFIIFLISPLILLGKVDYDLSITELKEENYKEKVRQRKMALIAGTIVYLSVFYIFN